MPAGKWKYQFRIVQTEMVSLLTVGIFRFKFGLSKPMQT